VGVVAGESAVMVKESSKVVGTEGTNWAERRVAVTEYFTNRRDQTRIGLV
jgi:hypothetical protein